LTGSLRAGSKRQSQESSGNNRTRKAGTTHGEQSPNNFQGDFEYAEILQDPGIPQADPGVTTSVSDN
jgi:hypothetical protein